MINIALFGLGRIGLMHGKNLMRNKDFKLKYVYDLNVKLTQKVAKVLKSYPINNPKVAFRDKKLDSIFITGGVHKDKAANEKFINDLLKQNEVESNFFQKELTW